MWLRTIGLALAAGCAGASTTPTPTDAAGTGDTGLDTVELANGEGTACLFGPTGAGTPYASPGDTELVAGGATEVRVVLDDCASGCASAIEASCTASWSGSQVVVSASGSYSVPAGPASCPSMCVAVAATCEGPMLGAGTYELIYGPPAVVVVPSAGPAPCSSGEGR